ncbi:MAG TPA: 16S rRNA (cytidine(1402)-2'-O)-methyltransferase [Desulfosalsimonadaceae bacterium]|nr:16S rRNA (cytidine(1402)-2'-O)-methyltransferase [Desulfosalsimonadaceae bacterium]
MTDPPIDAGSGLLYIVATPIGNLADITLRALDVLKTVELIAAEDTRHTRKLLSHYGISAKLTSCNEHNERTRAEELVRRLSSGASVALLSDAGTPTVSDPGYRLLQAAIAANIRIVPIPGPSAAMTALSAAGLPSDSFLFVGFLPPKSAKRQARLKQLANAAATVIFYESPNRIIALLQEIAELLGNRPVVVAREMTKRYEEFIRGRVEDVFIDLKARPDIKGEITLLVSGRESATEDFTEAVKEEIDAALRNGSTGTAKLSRDLAGRYGMPKNQVYEMILQIKAEMNQENGEKGDGADG